MNSIIEDIKSKQKGIIVINNDKIVYCDDTQRYEKYNLENLEFHEFLLSVDDAVTGFMKTVELDESQSAVIIIGKLNHSINECFELAKMFQMVKLEKSVHLISEIIGVTPNKEQEEKIKGLMYRSTLVPAKINGIPTKKKSSASVLTFSRKRLTSVISLSVVSIVIASVVLAIVILPEMKTLEQTAYGSVFRIDTSLNNEGDRLFQNGKLQEADEWYSESLKADPSNYIILTNKGSTLAERQMYEEAIVWYDKALSINPNYVNALINKGLVFVNLGEYEQAIIEYEQALDVDPNNLRAIDAYANILSLVDRNNEAIVWYDKALAVDPTDVDVLINKGNALAELELYDDAVKLYTKALNINPEHLDALYYQGVALYNLDKNDEAIVLLDKALEIDPDNTKIINLKKNILDEL